ncbi:MAG: aminotransferase class I/II-fold pyridoxal phosphate-dependent enzyme [Magnetococcales bacterium]|nr:aminotransferase class I/II-fold pyridoxal phosphate-dependent enzyme [Magnetococcales bacterium]
MSEQPALLGGVPAVGIPLPHANRLAFEAEDRQAVNHFMETGGSISFFGHEPYLKDLERRLADLFGRRFCLLLNSGTSALQVAYAALGLKSGEPVAVPANTFHATVTPLSLLGAIPRFVDCHANDGNLDPESLERLLRQTPGIRAAVVTHMWGHPADLDELQRLCHSFSIPLVEDVSLAVGAIRNGKRAGGVGTVACLSLGSTKLLSGGQGGALLCDDPEIIQRAILLSHFGPRAQREVMHSGLRPYATTGLGANLRIHPLAAAIVSSRLERFTERCAARSLRYRYLLSGLRDHPCLAPRESPEGVTLGSWQGFHMPLHAESMLTRDQLIRALRAEGLEVSGLEDYGKLHTRPLFRTPPTWNRHPQESPVPRDVCPNADAFFDRRLFFPLFLDEPLTLMDQYLEGCRKVGRYASQLAALFGNE